MFIYDNILLVCNGEIYNYKKLYSLLDKVQETTSDCEIILDLYLEFGLDYTIKLLDGVFSFVIENNKEPLAIVGVTGITHQQALMWTIFSEKMKDNWFSFVKASPKLIDYLHTHYHEIIVDTWEGNYKMIQWLGWLGFDLTEMYCNEHGFNMAHSSSYVNLPKKVSLMHEIFFASFFEQMQF